VSGIRVIAIVAIALSLIGCVNYGGAEAVKAISVQTARSSFVDRIDVTTVSGVNGEHLEDPMRRNLRQELDRCAVGDTPLNLEVMITEYKGQNAARTILIGDGTTLKGIARLVDPETGNIVGDYDFSESSGGGGLLAAVGMSGAALTREVAQSLCKHAFKS